MGMTFTPEQLEVIESRDCNILVSAAAGSGKTQVLTQRIVSIISDADNPVDIDHMLVVTFTDAAASEMRERIGGAIAKKLAEEPGNRHLAKQSVLIHRAFITTIDAFCKYVVNNHFGEIGIDPGMRALDNGEQELMMSQVMSELFEDKYSLFDGDEKQREAYEDFIYCVEALSERGDDSKLAEMINNIFKYAQSFPWPREWLMQVVNEYRVDSISDAGWFNYFIEDVRLTLASAAEYEEAAYNLVCDEEALKVFTEFFENEHAKIQAVIDHADAMEDAWDKYQVYLNEIGKITFDRLPGPKVKDEYLVSLKNTAKKLRDSAKEMVTGCIGMYFDISSKDLLAQVNDTHQLLSRLVSLVLEFSDRFAAAKLEEGVMDFSDMEHFALDILVERKDGVSIPTDTAKQLRDWFHEIMTDEYQDSNTVQEEILGAICKEEDGGHNRFMVGDVKQSIYRFRKARPELIMDKMITFFPKDEANRRIDLQKNFRSRRQVIDSVNDIFEGIMRPEVGGVSYDEAARLNFGAEYYRENESTQSTDKTEIVIFDTEGGKADEYKPAEAEIIAGLVEEHVGKTLVSDDEVDEEGKRKLRPCRYSDIAILIRNRSSSDYLERAFAAKRIPMLVETKGAYFTASEVALIINYLRVLDNPLQDIPLYSVMVSPLALFSEKDMAKIQALCPSGRLYERLEAYALSDGADAKMQERVRDFCEHIFEYRQLAKTESVQRIIGRIFDDTDYLQYVLALPDGVSKRANAELLLTKARQFEENGGGSIFTFLKYVEHLMKVKKDEGEAGTTDSTDDAVRVHTMHGSKGLEFPICIAAYMETEFDFRDTHKSFLMDMDLGAAVKDINPVSRTTADTLVRKILSRKMCVDTRGEELRLFYVAATRAREKLIMVGSKNKAQEWAAGIAASKEALGGKWPFGALSSTGSFLECAIIGYSPRSCDLKIVTADQLGDIHILEETEGAERGIDLSMNGMGEADPDMVQKLKEQFALEYPRRDLAALKAKMSVSELKAENYEKAVARKEKELMLDAMTEGDFATADFADDIIHAHSIQKRYTPSFIKERTDEKPTGADYGTAHHRIMELIDFEQAATKEGLARQIDEFTAAGLIPASYRELVSTDKVTYFVNSELGKSMMRAQKQGTLKKEQQFFLGLFANEINPELPSDETVLIQGIIDAFWEEDGEIIILDYKTDRVSEMSELLDRYETQMRYYAKAVERGCGKKVKRAVFYSFRLGKYIEVRL